MKKALRATAAIKLEEIPNIGKSIAADLRGIGITKPQELRKQNPVLLYLSLCRKTGQIHDPCVLDTFMAAVDFMNGGKPKPWWAFTIERRKTYAKIRRQLE